MEKSVLFRRPASQERGSLMASPISSIFSECVKLIRLMATLTGLSYKNNYHYFSNFADIIGADFFLIWQRKKPKSNQRKK